MPKELKILIVDDDPKLVALLSNKILDAGFHVFTAEDGLQGLEQAFKEHPNLILLDLNMPRLDGQGMLEKLRQNPWGKNVPVIVLTNRGRGQISYDAINDMAQGYILKTESSLKDVVDVVQSRLKS